jgi:hypothetical protein
VNHDAWNDVLEYLWRLGAHDLVGATDRLAEAIDRDGIGALNDAIAEACRSLMDRVLFPAGTIDVLAVVDTIATRVTDMSRDERPEAMDRLRSLLVFFGSEGLPCAARNDVASWSPEDRLHDSIASLIGLLGIVADDEQALVSEVVATIRAPEPPRRTDGTFALAWRGTNGAEPLAGVMPRGYTAHITFLGAEPCSLRSIFARVAMLRDVSPGITTDVTTTQQESQMSSSWSQRA